MTWTHVNKQPAYGLEEQWIRRMNNAPVVSLKRSVGIEGWSASMLNTNGLGVKVMHLSHHMNLETAQFACENELVNMGWKEEA